eukprot:4636158-Pyramimonas_sp.AAC.1
MEMRGQNPSSVQRLIVQLNRRPAGGGRRPLGFYNASTRMSGRLWRDRLRRWETYQGLGGQYSTSQGRGPNDTVWGQAAASEGASNMDMYYIAVLWDVLQFYENVPWDLLAINCTITNFSAAVLRMSVQSYTWPRYLQNDGMLMDSPDPRRGVVAGSASATFEAKMSLIPLMGEECEARANATNMLSLHIDDLSQHHWGRSMVK